MKENTANSNITKGSLLAIMAFLCMAIFGVLTKVALESSSAIWVSFIAYLTGTVALLPYIACQGVAYLHSNKRLFLWGRAIFGTIASLLYTFSLNYIPIVNATLLFNTAPIFIPLLSMFFLKNRIDKRIWFAVFLGFIGIIIIIKPTAEIFTQYGNIIGILSGISLAIAYLLMKLLVDTDPDMRIIFYYLGIGMLMQIPFLFFSHLLTLAGFIYAVLSGLFLLGAQLFLVNAYHYAQASQVGVYQYASVVFVGLLQWLFWDMIPDKSDFLGILLVAIAGITIISSPTSAK